MDYYSLFKLNNYQTLSYGFEGILLMCIGYYTIILDNINWLSNLNGEVVFILILFILTVGFIVDIHRYRHKYVKLITTYQRFVDNYLNETFIEINEHLALLK